MEPEGQLLAHLRTAGGRRRRRELEDLLAELGHVVGEDRRRAFVHGDTWRVCPDFHDHVTGLTHREAYKDIFVITLTKTLAVFVVIAVYYLTGIY